jgi:hypothetical protein
MVTSTSTAIQTQMTPTKIMGILTFAANQASQPFKIDRSFMYRSLNLRLTGTLTTTGTSSAASLGAGDEWALVKNIQLVANGGNILRSISGEQLVIMNYLLQGYQKDLCTLASSATSFSFDSVEPLWLCTPGDIGKTPIDTTLNATLLDDLFIQVTWGNYTDINASANAFTGTPSLEISADMAYFLDTRINPAFNLTQMGVRTSVNVAASIAGTQAFNMTLPVSQVYTFLLFNSKNTGTTQDSSAANSIGNIIIQSGVNQFYNFDAKLERRMNVFRMPLPTMAFSNFMANSKNLFDAWTLIKFPRYWLSSESFNTRGFQNCDMYVQNAAASQALDISLLSYNIIPTASVTG